MKYTILEETGDILGALRRYRTQYLREKGAVPDFVYLDRAAFSNLSELLKLVFGIQFHYTWLQSKKLYGMEIRVEEQN